MRKDTWLVIRIADSDKRVIVAGAKACGVSTSEFVRSLAVDRSVAWLEDDEPRSEEVADGA